jgi:hypothetical protein
MSLAAVHNAGDHDATLADPIQHKSSLLVKILSVFVDVVWVLGIIGACCQLLLTPIGLFRFMHHHFSGLPFYVMNRLFHFGIGSLVGTILLFLVSMVIWAIFLWIVWHLRKLMHSMKEGKTFIPDNPARIRKIGYAVLLWAPIEVIFYGSILRSVAWKIKPLLSLSGMPLRIFLEMVFFGLAILVIAEVFDRGVKLQQEQDLTV